MDKRTKPKRLEDADTTSVQKIVRSKIPISPDRELLLWEKWIQIRKEETTKLGHLVGRPPTDLAMNLLKNERVKMERKFALEYAQIEKKAKLGYALHEQPLRLRQECPDDNVYEIKRTRAELGRPPVIEHIGIPAYIQVTELGMAGTPERKDLVITDAEYLKYIKKREEELAKQIKRVDPFRPSTNKLIIQGVKRITPPPKMPNIPKITVDVPKSNAHELLENIYAVRINRSVWYKDIPGLKLGHLATYLKKSWHENCSSWNYYFNVPTNQVSRGKLFLQNLGTVTLRYYWRKIKRPLPNVPIDFINEQVFFFNKNENVLTPGQCRDICFTFVSRGPGIFQEFWELIFSNVCFFETVNEKICISLYGDAIENLGDIIRGVKNLKINVSKRSLDNMAIDILYEVINKVFGIVPQAYPYKKYFLEAQIFVMKNPVCFYHQTEVAQMKEIYSKELTPGETWDLGIDTWRRAMMSKQYDDRMRLFESLKKSHADLLKPWYEGDTLLKQKYDAVNNLWMQLANNMDAEYKRLLDIFFKKPVVGTKSTASKMFTMQSIDPLIQQNIRNIFYVHVYEHVANTIELCAGILSSLDSNRWIDFDFCRT